MLLNDTTKFDDITVGEMVVVTLDDTIAITRVTKINTKTFNAGGHQFTLDRGKHKGGNEWHKASVYRGEDNIQEAKNHIRKVKDLQLLRDFHYSELSQERMAIVLKVIKEHIKEVNPS